MNLILPETIPPTVRLTILDFKRAVFVGANGAGKTRLGVWLDENNINAHRISAQKVLVLPNTIKPIDIKQAKDLFLYGRLHPDPEWLEQAGKRTGRWESKPETHELNDFEHLVTLLQSEEFNEVLKAKNAVPPGQQFVMPVTNLDKLKLIWEKLLPHRNLNVLAGTFQTSIPGTTIVYPSSQMSDGERVIFYFVGEVLCAKPNSLIIVDEPENHVHKAIQSRLWDEIENARQDCAFVYLTHDIDFAVSRTNAQKIWVKKFENNRWDYELLDESVDIPEDIYLEILGSRKDILFVEGERSSLDFRLYKEIFRDQTVEPLTSSSKVVSSTKVFNDLHDKHRLNARGIIDRDRKTDAEIAALRQSAILFPDVAEVENFFLLEDVVRNVANNMHQDPNTVFATVKANVMAFFNAQLTRQITLHTQHRLYKIAERGLNGSFADQAALEAAKTKLVADFDVAGIYQSIQAEFEQYAQTNDYNSILKVFNNKGITASSNVTTLCHLANGRYHDYVFEEMIRNTPAGNAIRAFLQGKIN